MLTYCGRCALGFRVSINQTNQSVLAKVLGLIVRAESVRCLYKMGNSNAGAIMWFFTHTDIHKQSIWGYYSGHFTQEAVGKWGQERILI